MISPYCWGSYFGFSGSLGVPVIGWVLSDSCDKEEDGQTTPWSRARREVEFPIDVDWGRGLIGISDTCESSPYSEEFDGGWLDDSFGMTGELPGTWEGCTGLNCVETSCLLPTTQRSPRLRHDEHESEPDGSGIHSMVTTGTAIRSTV